MREFAPMAHGTHGWDEQYNNDMGLLFGEMAGVKTNNVLNVYTHSKTGATHALTGEGAVMRFYAAAPWAAGDIIAVNGEAVNPITLDGTALPAGGFVSGMWVVAVKDNKNLQFLTQSYAGVFADINSQLADKVNIIPMLLFPEHCDDFDKFENGYIRVSGDFKNSPSDNFNGEVFTRKNYPAYAVQTAIDYSNSRNMYYRQWGNGVWDIWRKIANAEPPQEYELPLADGYVKGGKTSYCKNKFDTVMVNFNINSDSPLPIGRSVVAMLPEGYRPNDHTMFAVIGGHEGAAGLPGWGVVYPDGGIYLHFDTPVQNFGGNVSFQSEQG